MSIFTFLGTQMLEMEHVSLFLSLTYLLSGSILNMRLILLTTVLLDLRLFSNSKGIFPDTFLNSFVIENA